jgi:hypothetical protein
VPAHVSCFMLPLSRAACLYICHSAWDAWRAVRHSPYSSDVFTRV